MKRLFLISLLCFLAISVKSQETFAQAGNSNKTGLSKNNPFQAHQYEKSILTYINELRNHPKNFYQKYIPAYLEKHKSRYTAYYTVSLKKTLLNQHPLPPFNTSQKLQNIARKQLRYLTHTLKGKKLMHNQGKISFAERVKGANLTCFAENLYRSTRNDPLAVVLDLLIDQGVSSLGHRKNLLHPKYNIIGIQSAVAPNGYKVTVMDFGCEHNK